VGQLNALGEQAPGDLQRRGHWFEPSTAHFAELLVNDAFLNRTNVRKDLLLAPRSAYVPQANSKPCLLCSAQNAVIIGYSTLLEGRDPLMVNALREIRSSALLPPKFPISEVI
jgi:hypothetical protein